MMVYQNNRRMVRNRGRGRGRGRSQARGMTLIEVLIVIAILLAIGGLIVVNMMPAKAGADVDLQRVQMNEVSRALDLFKLHVKRWPTEDEGLRALVSKEAIEDEAQAANWRGPYIDAPALKDQWLHDLVYQYPGQIRGEAYYDLISLGPDGEQGTADDITNHDRLKGSDGEIVKDDSGGAAAETPPAAE